MKVAAFEMNNYLYFKVNIIAEFFLSEKVNFFKRKIYDFKVRFTLHI